MPVFQNAMAKRLVRWMLPHTAPAPLDLDHPVQVDLAEAADEIERLSSAPAILAALKEAVSFENEDTLCLLGGPGHCDEHGEPNADDPCPDGRCRVHGCMVARINRWRALIAQTEGH